MTDQQALPKMNKRDIAELKMRYAEKILRNPDDSFSVALAICGNRTYEALQIDEAFKNDPEVEECKRLLIEEYGEEYFLPSKADMLRQVLTRAKDTPRDEDFVKLMKLAADMRGFIEKPGVNINNTVNNVTNKVMQIPVYVNASGEQMSPDEWEEKLLEQQQKLTEQ